MTIAGGAGLARLERYVAALPGGLDAYPDAQAKGSLVRQRARGSAREGAARARPAAAPAPRRGPAGRERVGPRGALRGAPARRRGRGRDERRRRLHLVARPQPRALREPRLQILMSVMSPAAMVRFAGRRWENWHRGTRLDLLGAADEGVSFELVFPPGLFDALMLRSSGRRSRPRSSSRTRRSRSSRWRRESPGRRGISCAGDAR